MIAWLAQYAQVCCEFATDRLQTSDKTSGTRGNIDQVGLRSLDSSFQFVEQSIDDDGHRDARVSQVEPDHSTGSGDGYCTIRLAASRYQIGQQLADYRGHRNSTAVTTDAGMQPLVVPVNDRQVIMRQRQVAAPTVLPANYAQLREPLAGREVKVTDQTLALVSSGGACTTHDQPIIGCDSKRGRQAVRVGCRLTIR